MQSGYIPNTHKEIQTRVNQMHTHNKHTDIDTHQNSKTVKTHILFRKHQHTHTLNAINHVGSLKPMQ